MNTTISDYLAPFKHLTKLHIVGPLVINEIDLAEPIIYVDGGSKLRYGQQGVSVGDGDSSQQPLDIQLDPKKDFSDLAFALKHIPENFTEIYLYGFVGGRLDHQLFNLGEVHHFLDKRNVPTTLFFDNHIICYSAGSWEFIHHGLFSLACLQETTITLTGEVDYPCQLATRVSVLSSLGLSNVANGTVDITCNKNIFVLFNE